MREIIGNTKVIKLSEVRIQVQRAVTLLEQEIDLVSDMAFVRYWLGDRFTGWLLTGRTSSEPAVGESDGTIIKHIIEDGRLKYETVQRTFGEINHANFVETVFAFCLEKALGQSKKRAKGIWIGADDENKLRIRIPHQ